MTGRKTLYLANPYGFSVQQREGPLEALEAALDAAGAAVWEPFSRNNQIDHAVPGWAWRIGQSDMRDVREADGLFAVVNGCPPDEGVMVELGMAVAWGKPVFLFRDDFRRCTDSEQLPAEPDGLHRPASHGLGGLLVHLHRRDRRSGEGSGAVVEGRGGRGMILMAARHKASRSSQPPIQQGNMACRNSPVSR